MYTYILKLFLISKINSQLKIEKVSLLNFWALFLAANFTAYFLSQRGKGEEVGGMV